MQLGHFGMAWGDFLMVPNNFEWFGVQYQNLFEFNNHSLVQFYHRNLAYFLFFYVILLAIFIFLNKITNLYKPLKIVITVLLLQALLGIFTLISNLNIYLASAHQITSVLLVFSALNLYYYRAK